MTDKEKHEHAPKPIDTREIENMSLDEIDALSPEEITRHLQRAELREKAMRLAQLSREIKKTRAQEEQVLSQQNDRINMEKHLIAQKKQTQLNCTHMKGGEGSGAVLSGPGTDAGDYSLARHILPSGTLMILCLRCGREEYSYNPLTRQPQTPGYVEFAKLPTRNHTSGSTLFLPIGMAPAQAR